MFNGIVEALHREMEELGEKIDSGIKMNAQDLDHIDKMAHALKCLATYEAMIGYGDSATWERTRSAGRRASRDDGYRGGYSSDSDSYNRRY